MKLITQKCSKTFEKLKKSNFQTIYHLLNNFSDIYKNLNIFSFIQKEFKY